jgi:hypothetical protein
LDTYRLCRRKFKLSRIDGWRQKSRKASLEIGKCLETALQYYYENGCKPDDFSDEWKRLWLKFESIELVYTDQEQDWKTVYQLGTEWAKLFHVIRDTLPIRNPKWQLQFLKELWPGDLNLGGINFMGYVDILSILADGTRLIIDVKTAKSSLPITSGMMALDGQLRKYAWLSGIREVGFLNFVKCDPNSFRKGVGVTLLEDTRDWKAGQVLVVAKYSAAKEDSAELFYLGTEETVHKMDEELDAISGKGAKEKTEAVFSGYLADGRLCVITRSALTKVKIQFVRGTIPEEDLPEIGQQLGTDTYAIFQAQKTGYPADGGVRFPNAICGWCEMRGICLKDNRLRDELLVQIGPKVEEDDWLKELETEETE